MENKDINKTIAEPLTHYLNSNIPSEDVNLWSTINDRLKAQEKPFEQPRKLMTKKWSYSFVTVAAVFAIVIVFLNPAIQNLVLNNLNGKNLDITNRIKVPTGSMAMGAPQPFDFPITIVSSSYPVHSNQTFIIQTTGKVWNGQKVKLYYLPDTDSNHIDLLYKKVLPTTAQYIGETPINSGKWSYEWQTPSSQSGGYGSFLIAALSDNGILSGTTVTTLKYNKLELSPSTAKIGQNVEIKGSGFVSGDVRVDLLKKGANGGYDLQTTVGSTHVNNGSFEYSFTLDPQINGNSITPGSYKVQAVIIPPNQARQGIFVDLTVQ